MYIEKLAKKCMKTYHSVFKMSKHIDPVCELIFGCQIFVINLHWKRKGINRHHDKNELVK